VLYKIILNNKFDLFWARILFLIQQIKNKHEGYKHVSLFSTVLLGEKESLRDINTISLNRKTFFTVVIHSDVLLSLWVTSTLV
jgi:hypothetical protein